MYVGMNWELVLMTSCPGGRNFGTVLVKHLPHAPTQNLHTRREARLTFDKFVIYNRFQGLACTGTQMRLYGPYPCELLLMADSLPPLLH